ncbi:myosin regulatory light chain 12A-like [Diprion similis]|uniref:myosin regulatory light chain 12A-like n=1 Tax=Diprion similis TaxID=362088 RepID=UPI001EF89FDE|nr:myosin regulatory light chain 12A-like [Diprion similis]
MSDLMVASEEFKESNPSKDKKKKKSLKTSEGKSKSSSRKSSTVLPAESEDAVVQIQEQEEIIQGEVAADDSSHNNGTVEEKPDVETLSKVQKKDVIMLREADFRKLAELKEAFHLFDINRDGYIDKEDLKFTFTSMGKPDVTDEALDQMLIEMSSSDVDFDAFVKLFGYKVVELDPEEELLAALSKWDYLGNGMISEERLKRDLQAWGDKFSAKEAERALEEAPLYKKDGDTFIDYVKFCQDICGLRNVEKTRDIEKEAEAYGRDLESLMK